MNLGQRLFYIVVDGQDVYMLSDLVIMSVAAYERKIALLEVYHKLGEAEALLDAGVPTVDGKEVFHRMQDSLRLPQHLA